MEKTISMNAVAFQDGEVWVVQGIQYNLVAMARSVQDIPKAFLNAMVERIAVADHLGLDPFLGVGPAPVRFHKMFEDSVTEIKPAQAIGRAEPTVRLASVSVAA